MATTRAVKYRRISDDSEGLELGVSRQDEDLTALADNRGYAVVGDYPDDDISASTRSKKPRPEYNRMIADAKAGLIDVILAYTSSRLTRRPREWEDLIELSERYGVRFEYVRSPSFDLNTADGRQIARMLAASDAATAERTGELVARARKQGAARGKFGGGPRPFGFEPDGITRRESECAVIASAAAAIIRGAQLRGLARDLRDKSVPPPPSLRSVASELRDGEVPAAGGRPWSAKILRGVLLRPRNKGVMVYQGEELPDAPCPWEPIVPADIHDQVVRILTNPERDTRAGTAPRHLGSGVYRCGVCDDGTRMQVAIGGHSPRYVCKKRPHLAAKVESVDSVVVAALLERLANPDAIDLIVPPRPGVDVAGLREERAAINERLAVIGGDVALGLLTRAAGTNATTRGSARIAEIDRLLAGAAGSDPVLADLITTADPGAKWFDLPLERQRMVLGQLADIRVDPTTHRGSKSFRPARLARSRWVGDAQTWGDKWGELISV